MPRQGGQDDLIEFQPSEHTFDRAKRIRLLHDLSLRGPAQPTDLADGHVEALLRAGELILCGMIRCDARRGEAGFGLWRDTWPLAHRPQWDWLVRQLKDSPDALRLEAFVAHGRALTAR